MLIERCEKAVEKALEKGSNQAEAFAQKKRVFVAEFSGKTFTECIERESQGIGLRVIQNKATGFAYSTQLADVTHVVEQGVQNAQVVAPDPLFYSLPEPGALPVLPSIYDPAWKSLHTSGYSDVLESVPRGGSGTVQITVRECSIVNSEGVSAGYKKSDCSLKFNVGRNVAASYCNFSHMDIHALSRFFERSLERKDLPLQKEKWDGTGQIVLEPRAVSALIYPLLMALNGRNVVESRSYLAGRNHQPIVSEEISLYDDGCYPNGLFTQPVDGEGVPSQTTPLIENGILVSFIYDSYYANRSGEKSTGNAVREGFKALPSCFFSNIVIQTGTASKDELVADTQHGILVNSLETGLVGSPMPRIAVPISKAFLIEKGSITAAARPAILTGDILTLFKDVVVSREQEQVFRFFNPWIAIRS